MEAAVTEAARRVGYYAYVDDGKVVQVYTYEDGRSTPVSPQVLTPWIPSPVSDHCSMRCIVGTSQDPPYRVAFIEKTPRVRVKFDDGDMSAWESGPKGTGGPVTPDNTAEQQGIYGYDPESRAWCDQRLRELGYLLPEDHPLLDLATQPPPEPAEAEPPLTDMLLDFSARVKDYLATRTEEARAQVLQLHERISARLPADDPRRTSLDALRRLCG